VAWRLPYVQFNDAGATWPCLTFDCDNREAMADGLCDLPPYGWLVPTERGAHVTWVLAAPVAKHAAAREAPRRYLTAVSEYFHHRLGADPSFAGLSRNPLHSDAGTVWGSPAPYSLGQLASVIPFNWQRPRVPQTGIGRNRAMFEAGMKWAGDERNRYLPVLRMLQSIRDRVCGAFEADHPYTVSEMRATARYIERRRARWERDGWHKPAWLAKQRNIALIGGEKRRAGKADRDLAIIKAVADGMSMRAVARLHGLTVSTVHYIAHREGVR